MSRPFEDLKVRLLRRVKKSVCWLYTGNPKAKRYPSFNIRGKNMKVHRASYIAFVGPIPKGKSVLHSCDNVRCINPEHLFLGTQGDNMRDMAKKGRNSNQFKYRTACSQGHEYKDHGFVIKGSKGMERRCRICECARVTAYYRRKKA